MDNQHGYQMEPVRTRDTTDTVDSKKDPFHTTHFEHPQLSPASSQIPINDVDTEKQTAADGSPMNVEPKMTFKRAMALISMAFLWSGSQIPLYLFGSDIPGIVDDIGGEDRYAWILLANLIPLASVTPFVGALSDLFGRKWVAIIGAVFLVVGSIVCGVAQNLNILIGGQALIGIGAGINELTALAVAAELAPKSKRGIYIGAMVLTILPYCPSGMYAQLVTHAGSWRWLGLWSGLWSFVGLVLCVIFFHPPPVTGTEDKMTIAKRIDYIGGLLSTAGVTALLAGLTWAGGQYSWHNAHVIAGMTIGIFCIVLFLIWEIWITKYPMFPRELGENPLTLTLVLLMTFFSGANFLGVLAFWTTEYIVVYGRVDDPVWNGLGSLPVGFGIIGGAVLCSALLSAFRNHVKWVMTGACVIMIAGAGAISAARPDNLKDMWFPVSIACIGVGAVIIPNQVLASVICPDHLIATITACTISVRILGASIGYAIFYNVLKTNYTKNAVKLVAFPLIQKLHIGNVTEITRIATLLASGDRQPILDMPGIAGNVTAWNIAIDAGRDCFAASTPIVYYISAGFGVAALVTALLLPTNMQKFMTRHVSVEYH